MSSSSSSTISTNTLSTSTTMYAPSNTPPPSPKAELCQKVLKIHAAITTTITTECHQNEKNNFWVRMQKTAPLLQKLNGFQNSDLASRLLQVKFDKEALSCKKTTQQLALSADTLRTQFANLCIAIKENNLASQYRILCDINKCLPFSDLEKSPWILSLQEILHDACQFHSMEKLVRPYRERDGSYAGILSNSSMIQWILLWINKRLPYTQKEQIVLMELALVYAIFYAGPREAEYLTDLPQITKRLSRLQNDEQAASITDSVFVYSSAKRRFMFLKFNLSTNTIEQPVACEGYEMWKKLLDS